MDIHESFARPTLHPALRWQHEPPRWTIRLAERCLRVEPASGTDFWQKTDNGHFLFAEVAGDFVLSTRVRFHPVHQYDQAGLMVRLSPACWLKTSIEYETTGPSRLGAVVTNHGYSDGSTQSIAADTREVWLRVRREGAAYIVDVSREGRRWEQIRIAHLMEDRERAAVAAGLYACSPRGGGFVAEFVHLNIDRGRLSPT